MTRRFLTSIVTSALGGAALLVAHITVPPLAAADGRFLLAGGLHWNHIENDEPANTDADAVRVGEEGTGVSLAVGWAFTPRFLLRLVASGSGHQTNDPDIDVTYSGLTLEAAYAFLEGRPVRPYVFGGLGGFSIRSQDDALRYETTGPGTAFGAGAIVMLGRHAMLDASLRAELINWEKQTAEVQVAQGRRYTIETPIEEDGAASSFRVAFGWLF